MSRIEIATEKIVLASGDITRKITGFSCDTKSELPEEYLNKEEYIFKHYNALSYCSKKEDSCKILFYIGEVYKEDIFNERLEIIKRCSQRLHEIKTRLREISKSWAGSETFII